MRNERTACSGCGAKTLAEHVRKIQNGKAISHLYNGPGRHRKGK